jgi:hypothetical protein
MAALAAAKEPCGDGLIDFEYQLTLPNGPIRWLNIMGHMEFVDIMEQSVADLVLCGLIARWTAMAHCFRPDELPRYLK